MRSRTATCGLVLAALIVCGWVVVAQEDDPGAAGLKATLKQIADAMTQGDVEALVDFVGESVMVVDGLGGTVQVMSKAELLEIMAGIEQAELDPEKFDLLVMGKAASARGDMSLTFEGETIIGKADVLFVQQGGAWVMQAVAMGPTEEEAAG